MENVAKRTPAKYVVEQYDGSNMQAINRMLDQFGHSPAERQGEGSLKLPNGTLLRIGEYLLFSPDTCSYFVENAEGFARDYVPEREAPDFGFPDDIVPVPTDINYMPTEALKAVVSLIKALENPDRAINYPTESLSKGIDALKVAKMWLMDHKGTTFRDHASRGKQ